MLEKLKLAAVVFLLGALLSGCSSGVQPAITPPSTLLVSTIQPATAPAIAPTKLVTQVARSYATQPFEPSNTPRPTVGIRSTPTAASTPLSLNSVDWASLPRLADVILTIDDTNNFGQYELRGLRFQHWATDELRDSCLLDCAKIVLSGSDDTLTVMILRAGGPQKAENTLKQLYADFAKAAGYEYTVDNADFWRDIPPNTWIYSRGWPIFDTSVGTQFGPLVLLIIYNYDICFYEAGERICEGDIGYLSSIPVEAMNLQLNKLRASGYPLQ